MACARPVYAVAFVCVCVRACVSAVARAAGGTKIEKNVLALNSFLQDDSSLVVKSAIPVKIHTEMDTGILAVECPLYSFSDIRKLTTYSLRCTT
jgi:hypothetical protein